MGTACQHLTGKSLVFLLESGDAAAAVDGFAVGFGVGVGA